jgi:hypothetical protein
VCWRAILVAALFAVNASASTLTLTPGGGGFTLLVCDDVLFTHHSKPEVLIIHGVTIPQGAWVLTCPRTNAPWHLIITGLCSTAARTTPSPGNYAFTC